MPIIPSRLDGQTLGFSLTAPDTTVDVLSLDIVSGAVTSAYLTSTDILNLQPAVSAIFSLVPSAQRAAGALGMLQRLITVAPSAAATVTLSAVNTAGNVYALRATISGAPSQIIAHLPFSADGQLAWATGTGGGSGTVTGVTASAPLASSGGATPNISLTGTVALANGGTGTNLSAANGLVGVNGGSASTTPLVSAQVTLGGVPTSDTATVDFQLKNGPINYTAALTFWGQFDPGATLANITVAAGAAGQVFPMADFATPAGSGSGRFVMISNANGVVNLIVQNTTAGETNLLLYGPGPGTDQIFVGGEAELVFPIP
jgi:hypothetical protein